MFSALGTVPVVSTVVRYKPSLLSWASKVVCCSDFGVLEIKLKVPPGSPRPYKLEEGPRKTSMRSMVLLSGAFG